MRVMLFKSSKQELHQIRFTLGVCEGLPHCQSISLFVLSEIRRSRVCRDRRRCANVLKPLIARRLTNDLKNEYKKPRTRPSVYRSYIRFCHELKEW